MPSMLFPLHPEGILSYRPGSSEQALQRVEGQPWEGTKPSILIHANGVTSVKGRYRAGLVLVFLMSLYLFSSAARSEWFYFLEWAPGNGSTDLLWRGMPARWMVWALFLVPLLIRLQPRYLVWGILILLIASQARCIHAFMNEADGTVIYCDDHPSFMLRLWIWGKTFPGLVAYNPYCNGGYKETAFLAAWTLSVGSLLLPLWKYFAVDSVYNIGILILFVGVLPGAGALSVRLVGGT